MSTIDELAKAMYDANKFVRPWDHPKTKAMWWPIYQRQARACLRQLAKIRHRKSKLTSASSNSGE